MYLGTMYVFSAIWSVYFQENVVVIVIGYVTIKFWQYV